MKLRFKTTCKDKYTGVKYERGKTYEFEETRGKEILRTGKAEIDKSEVVIINSLPQHEPQPIEEKPKEEVKVEKDLMTLLEEGVVVNLNDYKREEIIKLARKLKVATKGTKAEIIERILAKTNEE